MFFRRKRKDEAIESYDKENERAVLRCSICTGEQVAGFQNIHTGKIRDIVLIRDERDLEAFLKKYQVENIKKVY